MDYKTKGIVLAFKDPTCTNNGTAIKQIVFQQENGRKMYPSAFGKNILMLDGISPGDECELHFHIDGKESKSSSYNNVIIDNIKRV